MLSIYKKELRVYFVTATGYVFTAFMLLSAGIYVSLLNFVYYSPAFEYVIKKYVLCAFNSRSSFNNARFCRRKKTAHRTAFIYTAC